MYLNTGLTSTKNYGKTILTKVPGAVSVRVCVCVHSPWMCCESWIPSGYSRY